MAVGRNALTGATSRKADNWNRIEWHQVNSNVRRLQARIVKATKEGRWGKVSALQRLLTRSFSAKALAVKRVTENRGRHTPGIDRETWRIPQQKAAAIRALKQRGYRAKPLRRVYIPKANGKLRPLGIPTMRDRAMQALYLLALDPYAESTADPNSYGFRVGRSATDALTLCHIALSKKGSASWILEADIRACFDRISHEWLTANVPMEKKILRQWLNAGFMERNAFYSTFEGTPQGGIISPVLANLALDGLERRLRSIFPRSNRVTKSKRKMVNIIRYADDFIITANSQELVRDQIMPMVEEFLKERGLELSKEKTKITSIDDGFDFLGCNIRKYRGKLLTKPSKESVKRFLAKVRKLIRFHRAASAGQLIVKLNRLIRGWANYHRYYASKRTFAAIDHAIFWRLFRWAARRHSHQHRRWVRAKYFRQERARNWVFFGTLRSPAGRPYIVRLFKAADTKIVRHLLVSAASNPYEPMWQDYFECRRTRALPMFPFVAAPPFMDAL